MKESNKKLLELQNEIDKKLFNEGFFDNIRRKADQATEDRAIDKAHTEQKAAERERRNRVMTGRAIPPRLYKSSLRRYYTQRAMPIPPELDSDEDDHSAYKRKPGAVGEKVKGNASDFIGGALGLDPTQQKGLEAAVEAGGDVAGGIASATGAAYNYIKGLFGSKKAKEVLPAIEQASEDSARKSPTTPEITSPESEFTSLSSIENIDNTLAGIPGDEKFDYLYIKDLKKTFISTNRNVGQSIVDERSAQKFIDGHVSNIILGKKRIKINPKIKNVNWEIIYNNIKNDSINNKKDMGYMSGHYVVVISIISGKRKLRLVPVASLITAFPNLELNDLEN